jgi:hypothetical protein
MNLVIGIRGKIATINPEQYVQTLKKLKQRIRRVWPKRKMNQTLLLYENTRPAHKEGKYKY